MKRRIILITTETVLSAVLFTALRAEHINFKVKIFIVSVTVLAMACLLILMAVERLPEIGRKKINDGWNKALAQNISEKNKPHI